ncbi:hexaprenyldihydroxybenzoate methyltransferase [Pisolithus croceorrhizus]|nr:hexaprenyldihydroxybenzoate methyltransferase [Pisolithus croceorrhizus]
MTSSQSLQPHTHSVHNTDAHTHREVERANEEFFNDPAAEHLFNTPDVQETTRLVAAAMLKAVPFDKQKTVVMDFACGVGRPISDNDCAVSYISDDLPTIRPGLISQQLAPQAKSIIGVDISQRMVDIYNNSAKEQNLFPNEMKAVRVDRLVENETQLGGMSFDVIVCASSYHHLPSIVEVTRVLVSYLKPGGSLLVTDMAKGEYPMLQAHHPVPHKSGFDAEDMRAAFEAAGLHSFSFAEVATVEFAGHPVTMFLASGEK